MKTIYLSFSSLLRDIAQGMSFQDSSETLYIFGCTKMGIRETVERYSSWVKGVPEAWDGLRPILAKAEEEGRVHWRQADNASAAFGFIQGHTSVLLPPEEESENLIYLSKTKALCQVAWPSVEVFPL